MQPLAEQGAGRARLRPLLDRLQARNGGTAGLLALVAVLLLGAGLRLGYAWDGYEPPVFDAVAYARIAASVGEEGSFSQGSGFSPGEVQPASNYSPGLPLLAGGLYRVSGGTDPRLARVVLGLIASLSVVFAYLIGRRLAGPGAGLVAGLAVAVYPALLEYGGMLMTEPLGAALLSGSVLAMFRASDRPGAARWLGPGVLLGITAMVRPEYLAIAVLLAAAVLLRGVRERPRAALAEAAVMLAAVAVVIAPWTIRNLVVLDRFVPISTGGGQVLFAGTYLPSGGDPLRVGEEVLERHPGVRHDLLGDRPSGSGREEPRLEQILAALAARRYPGTDSDVALARMGRRQLLDNIGEKPVEYAGFLAAKLELLWLHGPRPVMREPVWAAFHWLLAGLALVGLVGLAVARRWEALVIGTILVAITAIGLLLVASPRRTLVAIPLIAALAGAGVAWCAATVRPGQPRGGLDARAPG